jgi:hypothetical protein
METPGVDALYGEPLDTFTAARNALAKALTQVADREGAAAVRALRKPSTTAWALNQLARTRPADVERVLTAGEELRNAQHDALEGGDPARLRDARRAHDGEVDRVASMASELLSETGKPAGPAQHDRLVSTLQAVAGDEESRELLRRGRLVHDLEPAGFGFADDLTTVSTPSPRERREPREPRQAERPRRATPAAAEREQSKAREEGRREARRLAAAADRAAARADRLSREADEAERNAIELRRLADESREELAAARRAAEAAGRRSESVRPVP